ncbi:lytic murein transglycosylase B [Cellvibrio mixtus]|uniref:lytic murein transglycosylase B n=1 Tax=Cellvibrio mixtus TaxID=39650 RepID=UPI0006934550|nr:lytic murein transglycosylase B [Cellvibrio mixtus]
MQFAKIKALLALVALGASATTSADYTRHPLAAEFVNEMVQQHGFTADEINQWLSKAEKRQPILDSIARPAEKSKTWKEYRPIFIVPMRITNGVNFWNENREALARAEKEYGVPAEIIVAIIGVETNYGKNTGNWYVIDALTTLAFDYPPRAPFFRSELVNYFILTREQKHDPLEFKGSYAGAMGYGQFMPSSYRNFAVDFSGDGFTDIWKNPTDAIGSIANYFKKHGWQQGKPVVVPAKLVRAREQVVVHESFNKVEVPAVTVADWKKVGVVPKARIAARTPVISIEFDGVNGLEYWMGLQNFYTITRYNRSPMYAMAVYDLSLDIKAAMKKSGAKK